MHKPHSADWSKIEPHVAPRIHKFERKPRVLIVEDSPIVRERLVNLIKQADTVDVVGCAENGVQGVEMLIALRPDVVLLDLQLPGLSGFDILPTIKRERPECKVIVLTCLADENTRERCLKLGADHFFDKSSGLDQILQLLNHKS
ncbi:MAG: response regulator transcription factor [Verrucomicrobiales bacterium]|nr:response regulator transcription factor [Verrucomicrobiales bacterium]